MRLESKRFREFCESANVFLDITLAEDFVCPGLLEAMNLHASPLLLVTTDGIQLVVVAITMDADELQAMIDHGCDGFEVESPNSPFNSPTEPA